MKKKNEESDSALFTSFRAGVIALVFMIVGFQLALFVHKAAQTRILANRDEPDTVYVVRPDTSVSGSNAPIVVGRHDAPHEERVEDIRQNTPRRKVESFRFNPNTASVEDLERLGFTPKQAQAIDNYRQKGGHYSRKSDFQKSFVVSDSVYRRLEPYIDIPLIDINKADSAAFDALPGIGGWFASQMVEYRKRLGGYSCKEQLMEIYHFDQEKFDGLKDMITISQSAPYALWTLPADSLRIHPHIHDWHTAKAIVFYRDNTDRSRWTIDGLESAGVITSAQATGLRRCRIAEP